MPERRRAPRVKVNLPARWEGVLTVLEGAVTSLSRNGCFVLTGGKVEPKELIRLEVSTSEGQTVFIWGEVVDEAFEIGFALRFTSMEPEEEARLAQFLSSALGGS